MGIPAGGYNGYLTLTRAQCIMTIAYGGHVLLSNASAELLHGQLPEGVTLRDTGDHRFKCLVDLERLWQLVDPDLVADFPPLPSYMTISHNLPTQPTALIGREQEVAAACDLLCKPDVRLLTLTGPGGTGKTRLGLQVAAELLEEFADGVVFVTLAPVSDPTLVIPAIAAALGVKEGASQPLLETLKTALHDKQRLLLLDNFEQVVAAAPLVAELLAAAPYLKVLVTSRAALHLSGERELAVPPLGLPDRTDLPPLQRLTQYDAVRLFIERAQAVQAHFAVTNANAPTVAEICHRLDGLPLAIELAAARIKLFSPQALLARLGNRLKLLTGGARDLPARQQTIRDAIAWSYDLLDAGEQQLFTRLCVFVNGWTLEAAEAVCGADNELTINELTIDVIDGVASLLDKSLIQQAEGIGDEPRFTMLETIREYALERLALRGEETVLRRRHALHYLAKTIQVGSAHELFEKDATGHGLVAEIDNLREAIRWALDQHEGETAQRLSVALYWFGGDRIHQSEGSTWLEAALAISEPEHRSPSASAVLADALDAAGWAAWHLGDCDRAQAHFTARLAVCRELGDLAGQALAQRGIGWIALQRGDLAAAQPWVEGSLALCREAYDPDGIAWSLYDLGYLTLVRGELAQAETLLAESLALFRQQRNEFGCHRALLNLGHAARLQGQVARAVAWYQEGLAGRRYHFRAHFTASSLEDLAGMARMQGRPEHAARLFGTAEALRESVGEPLPPVMRAEYERDVAATRTQLDQPTFAAAWEAGRKMTLDQGIAHALDTILNMSPPTPSAIPPSIPALPAHPAGLTEREVEVLRLLVQGLSYAEIAAQLVISPRTVNRHLTAIYSKLGVTSRHTATRLALNQHLV